jgi:sarcosine oxidase subunit gamma
MFPSKSPLDCHFDGLPGDGLVATNRCGLSIAALIARKGRIDDLAKIVDCHYGINLPRGPFRTTLGAHAFLGLSRESWLVISDQARSLEIELRNLVADTASVVDQSDAYGVLHLSGAKLRNTLLKMLPLDLHPKAFPVGYVASSVASHVAIRLWRLDDAPDGSPTFEVAIGRSFVRTFWLSFIECAGEFGVTAVSSSRAHP